MITSKGEPCVKCGGRNYAMVVIQDMEADEWPTGSQCLGCGKVKVHPTLPPDWTPESSASHPPERSDG